MEILVLQLQSICLQMFLPSEVIETPFLEIF